MVGVVVIAVAAGLAGEWLSRLEIGLAEPPMTQTERYGQTLYQSDCASCHGGARTGLGTRGPALIGGPYGPGAVDLARLSRAVRLGSGAMPRIAQIDRDEIQAISDYLVYRAALPQ